MTMDAVLEYARSHWRDGAEILVLSCGIYFVWLLFRGTRGARVLTGLATLFLLVLILSQLLDLAVIGYLFRNLSTFLVFALLVIFQPELRRALASLGSDRLFASATHNREVAEKLTEATFDLANRQLGALIAIERDSNLESFAETGVDMDCKISPELLVTLFFPKTPLHDGGVIIRNDRIQCAACIFPVTERTDLDRTLGMRHRAALGLTEQSDAVVIIVSEETGIVSLCHRGNIERNFDPENFLKSLGQLLTLEKNEKSTAQKLGGKDRLADSGIHPLGRGQEEHRDDRLAF